MILHTAQYWKINQRKERLRFNGLGGNLEIVRSSDLAWSPRRARNKITFLRTIHPNGDETRKRGVGFKFWNESKSGSHFSGRIYGRLSKLVRASTEEGGGHDETPRRTDSVPGWNIRERRRGEGKRRVSGFVESWQPARYRSDRSSVFPAAIRSIVCREISEKTRLCGYGHDK